MPLTLVIDAGSGAPHMCEVHAPTGGPIATLLDNAVASDTPSTCVTSWTGSSDGQRVSEVNGVTEIAGQRTWHIQRSGIPAALGDQLALGDLVFLSYGP